MDNENTALLLSGEHHHPHRVLGLHGRTLTLWAPGSKELFFSLRGKVVQAQQIHEGGLFTYELDSQATARDYQIYHSDGRLDYDPYTFTPTIGDLDQHLFAGGVHYELYRVLGGRLTTHQGVKGARFAVWAPNAKRVSLVGDINHWDGRRHPMRPIGGSGIWELFVPGMAEGDKYKFEIKTPLGEILLKSDPFGYGAEKRPATASILYNLDNHQWQDAAWTEKRSANSPLGQAISVYEVHLGSWKSDRGEPLSYMELAKELADYCNEMGFTHVELLPVAEHPLDESWGYQVTGYYAVTSRYGTPGDFQAFVDHLHQQGIGVLLDWVPGHFPVDAFALARFDGTCLYEHEDPRKGFHPHWNTLIFNYGRREVANFLLANALFWFDLYHIDGLRVDAVASMLYLDYGRAEGEWVANIYGGRENIEAIEFLKHLNSVVHQRHSNVMMIAEESTSFASVTHLVDHGGLGFDLKWNMGWMNDTLGYFQRDMLFRGFHHNQLTFGMLYAYSERFLLVLSHDEVVHGKKSLLGKMPGDDWQRFANVRLLFSYMLCQPGKKLLFMGGEIGQWSEWYCKVSLDWHLLQSPQHLSLQRFVAACNHFYRAHPALFERDFDWQGFEWIDFSDRENSVVVYRRRGNQSELICVHHFTPTHLPHYVIAIKGITSVRERLNSDSAEYGGSHKCNENVQLVKDHFQETVGFAIQLAPLATQIFEAKYD